MVANLPLNLGVPGLLLTVQTLKHQQPQERSRKTHGNPAKPRTPPHPPRPRFFAPF